MVSRRSPYVRLRCVFRAATRRDRQAAPTGTPLPYMIRFVYRSDEGVAPYGRRGNARRSAGKGDREAVDEESQKRFLLGFLPHHNYSGWSPVVKGTHRPNYERCAFVLPVKFMIPDGHDIRPRSPDPGGRGDGGVVEIEHPCGQ